MAVSQVTAELFGEGEQEQGRPVVKFYLGRVYMDPIEREHAIEEGRMTEEDLDYVETDFVRISFPGNRFTVFDQPVKFKASGMDPDDRAHPDRFPREWGMYKNRQEGPIGTPLNAIPSLNASDIKHLDRFDVLTVENLAGLSDIAVMAIGNGVSRFREVARNWLRARAKPVVDMAAQGEINDLKAQIAEMREMILNQQPKRGRPAKIEESPDAIAE